MVITGFGHDMQSLNEIVYNFKFNARTQSS